MNPKKLERKRKQLQARELAAVGGPNSLFRDFARTVTHDEVAWHLRRTRAVSVEQFHASPASTLELAMRTFLVVSSIEPYAESVVGGDFNLLRDHCQNTYPSPLYWYSFWRGVLCGESKIVFEWQRVTAPNTVGYCCVPKVWWPADGWVAPMTRDEFHCRWPYQAPELSPEPEVANELFQSVLMRLGVAA